MRERTGAAFGMGAVVLGLCVSNEIPMFVYMRCGIELGVCVRIKCGVQSKVDRDIGWYTSYV